MKGDPMKKLSEEVLKGMTDGELKTTARRLETKAGKMRKGHTGYSKPRRGDLLHPARA